MSEEKKKRDRGKAPWAVSEHCSLSDQLRHCMQKAALIPSEQSTQLRSERCHAAWVMHYRSQRKKPWEEEVWTEAGLEMG